MICGLRNYATLGANIVLIEPVGDCISPVNLSEDGFMINTMKKAIQKGITIVLA